MLALAGYRDVETLSETDDVAVYRGVTAIGGEPRIIKVFDVRRASPTAVARLKNEYQRLQSSGVDIS